MVRRERSSWQVENEKKGRKRKVFREKEKGNERKNEKTENNGEGTKAPQRGDSQLWWGEKG